MRQYPGNQRPRKGLDGDIAPSPCECFLHERNCAALILKCKYSPQKKKAYEGPTEERPCWAVDQTQEGEVSCGHPKARAHARHLGRC